MFNYSEKEKSLVYSLVFCMLLLYKINVLYTKLSTACLYSLVSVIATFYYILFCIDSSITHNTTHQHIQYNAYTTVFHYLIFCCKILIGKYLFWIKWNIFSYDTLQYTIRFDEIIRVTYLYWKDIQKVENCCQDYTRDTI